MNLLAIPEVPLALDADEVTYMKWRLDMAEFVKVADDEIPVGQGKQVEYGGQQVAVFNVDGAYHAVHNAIG